MTHRFFQNDKKPGITRKIFLSVLVYLVLENVSKQETGLDEELKVNIDLKENHLRLINFNNLFYAQEFIQNCFLFIYSFNPFKFLVICVE